MLLFIVLGFKLNSIHYLILLESIISQRIRLLAVMRFKNKRRVFKDWCVICILFFLWISRLISVFSVFIAFLLIFQVKSLLFCKKVLMSVWYIFEFWVKWWFCLFITDLSLLDFLQVFRWWLLLLSRDVLSESFAHLVQE